MDAAISEPIRTSQRDGKSFILMSAQIYDGSRHEIEALQRRLLGMTEIVDGKTTSIIRR
jgi:hypothetical protein